jgi:hypothetical protein
VKVISTAFLVVLVVSWLPACAKKDKIVKGTCQGVYEMSRTMHEMEHPDVQIEPERQYPPYDQYEREREEMTKTGEEEP